MRGLVRTCCAVPLIVVLDGIARIRTTSGPILRTADAAGSTAS